MVKRWTIKALDKTFKIHYGYLISVWWKDLYLKEIFDKCYHLYFEAQKLKLLMKV